MAEGDPLTDISQEISGEDAYLPQLDENTQREVASHLNSRLFGHVDEHQLFSLLLVMLGLRPACIIAGRKPAISVANAEELAGDHRALTTSDPLGQFLETYEIPYILTTSVHKGGPNSPANVHLNYHISFDEQRLDKVEKYRPGMRQEGATLSRREEEVMGRFLGYPEPAVQAYCNGEGNTEGKALETVSDEKLEKALGELTHFYDGLDLDYREFTKLAVPYVIPVTAAECLDQAVKDAGRFLFGGIVADEKYDIKLLNAVIADYRDRFAPDT